MVRDAAYVALLARLRAALPTVTWTRNPADWTRMAEVPMGMLESTEQTSIGPDIGPPNAWHLGAQATIWFRVQPGSVPDTTLNGYVDTINAALDLQEGERALDCQTTLGGVVQATWISGTVRFADEAQVSGVLIPITMLVAD